MRHAIAAFVILGGGIGHAADADKPVTFTKDVAPILWKNCADCHHPGHVAPFPLLTYKDAAKRATFIRDVSVSRRMPPWKPEPGFGAHVGARRLSDAELTTLAKWAETGAPEGDPKDLPPAPEFREGWQLGEPDMILKMPEPYNVPADGPDVYRCFIVPIPIDADKDVIGVEFKPSNRRVIHHAVFHLDENGLARKRDREDGLQPGYTSIGTPGFRTSGSLGGWGLAHLPRFLPDGIGMPVKKGTELVLQVHYHPSGKPETDQSTVGLYFAKKPVSKYVTRFNVRRGYFEIPAGEKRFTSSVDSVPLPVDVTAMSIAPHMHNLGREVQVTARIPGGEVIPLVRVNDWDFHWQETYYFEKPLRLPKGTVLRLEAWFDNSSENPKNPNKPPKLVKRGNNLSDEMSGCNMQVIVDSLADLKLIQSMKESTDVMVSPTAKAEKP